VPRAGIVEADDDAGVVDAGLAAHTVVTLVIVDKGDEAGDALQALVDQHVPCDDVSCVGTVGAQRGERSHAALVADVGLGQPRLSVGDAGGGRQVEELLEGQAVRGQVDEEVSGEGDDLAPDDDRSTGVMVAGGVDRDPLDLADDVRQRRRRLGLGDPPHQQQQEREWKKLRGCDDPFPYHHVKIRTGAVSPIHCASSLQEFTGRFVKRLRFHLRSRPGSPCRPGLRLW